MRRWLEQVWGTLLLFQRWKRIKIELGKCWKGLHQQRRSSGLHSFSGWAVFCLQYFNYSHLAGRIRHYIRGMLFSFSLQYLIICRLCWNCTVFLKSCWDKKWKRFLTIIIPVVYMGLDVWIWMGEKSIMRVVWIGGPWNWDFFGPWNRNGQFGPQNMEISWPTPSNGPRNGFPSKYKRPAP